MKFGMGYNPARAMAKRAELLASGRYCTVSPAGDIPKAKSLSKNRLRVLDQGQAGTCWVHAATALAEWTAKARNPEAAFPICRMLTAYEGKKLEGGGNPTDGGDPTDAIDAMTAEKGAGIAHESLWPYSDKTRDLAGYPPPAVISDAKDCHLVSPIVVNTLDEAKILIANDHPVVIGTWWPSAWSAKKTFFDGFGFGSYGHAVMLMGYAEPGVFPGTYGKQGWWEVENSWALPYIPLPDDCAAILDGYSPAQLDAASDFFASYGAMDRLFAKDGFIAVSATDIQGIADGIVVPSFGLSLPL